ncbi:unnamed protein product, partial [Rotaria magnacalcarata]
QIIDKPTEFTIDTHNAGEATLRVQAMDQEYQPIDVHVRDNGNSTFTCRYTPRNSKPSKKVFFSLKYKLN